MTGMTNEANPAPALLHWAASTALLCAVCLAVAWVTACSAEPGQAFGEVGPVWSALVALLGLNPFFMRRNHGFTLAGLLVVGGVGVGLAALGWLVGFNMIVFAWLGMTWVLPRVAWSTAWGRMVEHDIRLEQGTGKSRLPTKTEQHERTLFLYDFATVLLVIFALLVLAWALGKWR